MHVVIFFINIGFYHGARLRGALQACEARGWNLSAVQLTDDTLEHPWGEAGQGLGVPLTTLMPKNDEGVEVPRRDDLPLVSQYVVDAHMDHLKPDVVFLPGWSFDMCHKVLKWAVRHGVPAVVMSESKHDDEPRSWWKEKLKSWLYLRKFDSALVGGDAHATYVAELGIPKNRIFKGYDAVDNAHFARSADEARAQELQVRSRYSKMTPRPYFMAAFRLMPRKNAVTLLAAYEAYHSRLGAEAWDLIICGSGEQRDELLAIIETRQLSANVHLVGFLPYHEVGYWYGLAQAFIHPALKEQWGLVINEACAAGLPVLCSKTVGAAPDLVHEGVNGFLFDPTDVEEMTSCMVKIHEVGDEGRKRLGQQSRRLVAACAPEVFGSSLVAAALIATRRG
jgi:1,2-diacylglycerol 3-alpha-glucosyltransferase